MSGLDISRPWQELTAPAIAAIPAQLGVYEIAVGSEPELETVRIGFAGGHELFGLQSALDRELQRQPPVWFRYELTHGYLTRWEELLMVYHARHGRLPDGNADHLHKVGTLSLDG